MEFSSNFSPIVLCSNLFSRLFEIGEKMLKNPFSFLQFTKKAQKAILWNRIHFFVKFVNFTGKLLSISILYLACPKHVGTPCMYLFRMDYDQMMEDLVLPLFPLTYLLMVRRRNLSQWIFKFLNDKGGASSQRLPSETLDDNCQEMSDTISLAFPSTVFSVVSDDDNDDFL